jgi:hypothetical protein
MRTAICHPLLQHHESQLRLYSIVNSVPRYTTQNYNIAEGGVTSLIYREANISKIMEMIPSKNYSLCSHLVSLK